MFITESDVLEHELLRFSIDRVTGRADHSRKLKEGIAGRADNGHGVFDDFTRNALGGYLNANRMLSLGPILSPLPRPFSDATEFTEVKHLAKTALERLKSPCSSWTSASIDTTRNLTTVFPLTVLVNRWRAER